MSARRLHNYIRTHRKKAGLSQEDMAFLIGARQKMNVSRYERAEREPSLRVALAYQAVFDKPVSELFAGLYDQVATNVDVRARHLARRMTNDVTQP